MDGKIQQQHNMSLAAKNAEVAEFMRTHLDGSKHPALMATPGSGIIVDQNANVGPEMLGDEILG